MKRYIPKLRDHPVLRTVRKEELEGTEEDWKKLILGAVTSQVNNERYNKYYIDLWKEVRNCQPFNPEHPHGLLGVVVSALNRLYSRKDLLVRGYTAIGTPLQTYGMDGWFECDDLCVTIRLTRNPAHKKTNADVLFRITDTELHLCMSVHQYFESRRSGVLSL